MYTLQWRELSGMPRWTQCDDAGRVRAVAEAISTAAWQKEARITSTGENWSVITDVDSLRTWRGGPPPRRLLASSTEVDSAAGEQRDRFMRAIGVACATGLVGGVLGPRQAEALTAIAQAAMDREGPAACAPSLEVVRPARLSGGRQRV